MPPERMRRPAGAAEPTEASGTSVPDNPKYEGHFPPGSMLPKIIASLTFLEQGGKEVIITTPECLPAALRGETGTHIIKT